MPLRLEAAILSRTRSPITSRSNWAKETKYVKREPAHAAGRIERLGHRHKGHGMLVEQFHQLGEIRQRPGQPVYLVDHHNINLAGPDIGQEALQGRAVKGGP